LSSSHRLAPTRELAFQIRETCDSLGAAIGLKTAVIIGGIDMVTQAITLQKKPHVIVATPGRIVDHLENTKGFHLKTLQYLIMDEADRILTMDFEEEVCVCVCVWGVSRTSWKGANSVVLDVLCRCVRVFEGEG